MAANDVKVDWEKAPCNKKKRLLTDEEIQEMLRPKKKHEDVNKEGSSERLRESTAKKWWNDEPRAM